MNNQDWQDDFIDLLRFEFESSKRRNPRLSMRGFATKTGLSVGSMSDILRKQKRWDVTAKRALAILETLEVENTAKNRLKIKMGVEPTIEAAPLSDQNHSLLESWINYPVLFAFDIGGEYAQAPAIAKRLRVAESVVVTAIADLLQAGLLTKNEDGVIVRFKGDLKSSDGPPHASVRKHHQDNLDLAGKALVSQPPPQRDFTTYTFAGSAGQLESLRKEIRDLYARAATIMDAGDANDTVYRMSIQLFPIEFP